jgi:hypothetical protein
MQGSIRQGPAAGARAKGWLAAEHVNLRLLSRDRGAAPHLPCLDGCAIAALLN